MQFYMNMKKNNNTKTDACGTATAHLLSGKMKWPASRMRPQTDALSLSKDKLMWRWDAPTPTYTWRNKCAFKVFGFCMVSRIVTYLQSMGALM